MIWISVIEAAKLLIKTERAVRQSITNNKYTVRKKRGKGRGGIQYEIALESLPKEAQEKYWHEDIKKNTPDLTEIYNKKFLAPAELKAYIVKWYQSSGLSATEYVKKYNGQNPNDTITESQLYRYQRKYKKGEIESLIDGRGGYNRGKNSIQQEAWEWFYALYMTEQKRTVKLCYDKTKDKFPNIPSLSTFERKVREIPKYAIVRYREGLKKFNDVLPSMERDKTTIKSNDIWFSDHHLMDVFVRNAKGKAVRPWLTLFFDARSNKVISYFLRDSDPNATAIKECLYKGIKSHGVPKEFYFDNGKDYRSKAFSDDFNMSICNNLGINCIYATPYHGQAKSVERFFGTLESRFGKLFPTYAGKDAKNRPECMNISNDEIAKKAIDFKEFENALSNYLNEYNGTQSKGNGMQNKTPNQVYDENLVSKAEIRDEKYLRILCGTFVERTVHKNGILLFNNNYYHEKLIHYFGEKVIVSYIPENIDKVNIFDIDKKAICTANAKIVTAYRDTSEDDYKKAQRKRRKVKNYVKEYEPKRNIDLRDIIVTEQLKEIENNNTNTETSTSINKNDNKVIECRNIKHKNNASILNTSEDDIQDRKKGERERTNILLSLYEKQQVVGG